VTFEEIFRDKLVQQIHATDVGFLLGAGASYLNGVGYPLASGLWSTVREGISPEDRELIEAEVTRRACGLEEALDVLDDGSVPRQQLRHRVASAIADHFRALDPPLEHHSSFVAGLSKRRDRRVRVFSLNYDPLMENAADNERLPLSDGFTGTNNFFFDARSLELLVGIPSRRRQKAVSDPIRGVINLYKLHGSIGWFSDERNVIRRCRPQDPIPSGATLLMIPPHYRKAQDTGTPPYSTLWSEFRGILNNDRLRLLNRLVCVGYGLGDTHVNPILEAALVRPDFTMLILARNLPEATFDYWKAFGNVIVATQQRCVLYREEGPGIPEIWSFEWLAREVNKNA
jgi:hypothetical protein